MCNNQFCIDSISDHPKKNKSNIVYTEQRQKKSQTSKIKLNANKYIGYKKRNIKQN